MCIQSVGEKSALNAIFLGPPSSSMMAISGGTMQSYCSSRFFDFFWRLLLVKIPHLAFIDENLNGISDHLSFHKWRFLLFMNQFVRHNFELLLLKA